jgi:hypothetical protein
MATATSLCRSGDGADERSRALQRTSFWDSGRIPSHATDAVTRNRSIYIAFEASPCILAALQKHYCTAHATPQPQQELSH